MKDLYGLSEAQRRVIEKMRDGWGLGADRTFDGPKPWLQRNGVGKGGETERVATGTYHALRVRKIIVCEDERAFPTVTWKLADEWKGGDE